MIKKKRRTYMNAIVNQNHHLMQFISQSNSDSDQQLKLIAWRIVIMDSNGEHHENFFSNL
jgi:hypothetical protein